MNKSKYFKWSLCVAAIFALTVWAVNFEWSGKKQASMDAALVSFPVFIRTNGGMLEVGKIKYRKIYQLKNIHTLLGFELPFCEENSSIIIDTHITYRVRLAKMWRAEYTKETIYVTAPPLEPALPVAFDTTDMNEQLTKCPLMLNLDTRRELLRSLSAELEREAKAPSRIDFARGQGARNTVREFVQKWLKTQTGQDIPANTRIDVAFADE